MKFLVIGHSRSGTGYMAALLQCFGYLVGHETMARDGISCNGWSTHDPHPPWCPGQRPEGFDRVIHVIRHPMDVIASVAYTDSNECWNADHDAYALDPVGGVDGCLARGFGSCTPTHHRRKYTVQFPEWSHINNVALVYLQWTNMVQAQGPNLTVQVENAPDVLAWYLKTTATSPLPPKDTNTRRHNEVHMHQLNEPMRGAITRFCERWGYEVPEDA